MIRRAMNYPDIPDGSRLSSVEARCTLTLAIGRVLRLLSRPEQPGDVVAYHEARAAALDAAESLGRPTSAEYRPSWAQDRLRGAVGD